MDFAGGTGTPQDLGFRLVRTGEIKSDWADRSIMAGLESPIFRAARARLAGASGVFSAAATGEVGWWVVAGGKA